MKAQHPPESLISPAPAARKIGLAEKGRFSWLDASMNGFGIRAKVAALTGFCLVFALIATLVLLSWMQLNVNRDREVLTSYMRWMELARVQQVNFKKQVQEWNNILLRGHRPEDFERHRQLFLVQERLVQENGKALTGMLTQPALRAREDEFLKVHEELGRRYRNALGVFEQSGRLNFQSVDRLVRGMDHVPTDLIDGLVASIANDFDQYKTSLAAVVLDEQRYAVGAALSVFLGLMLASHLLARRITRSIHDLTRTVARVSAEKDYSLRAQRSSRDELGLLTDGFNEMLAQIQQKNATLQQSHDDLAERVAERDHAEEALLVSQALYHSLVVQLPVGIFRKDAAGRYVFVNPRFCELKHMPADQILGWTAPEICAHESQNATSMWLPELAVQGTLHHEQIMQSGQPVALEETYNGPDGQPQHWQVVKSAVFGPDQAIIGSQGVVLDITERKRTERALRESEEHFRFLNDLAKATRALADPEQIMAVTARMLGEHLGASRCAYADVEKDGEQFAILHDYTDGCTSTVGNYQLSLFGARPVAKLQSGQTLIIRNVEAELLPGDGAEMFNAIGIQAIITCPLVKDGILRAMMAVHQTTPRDWTPGEVAIVQEVVERCWATIERRTAEENLRQSEALLHIAGRTARLGGWTVDLPEVRITWSDEMCAIHDVAPGTVPEFEQALSSYAPQSREPLRKAYEACVREGTPFDLEAELITAKGRQVWVRAIGEAERNAGGTITRVQGALQDITARRQAALELEQAHTQLLAASLKADMAEFATGILHDIGNVLNSANIASFCVADSLRKSKAANLSKVVALLREHENDLGDFFTNNPKGRQVPVYLAQLAGQLAEEQAGALKELAQLQKNIEHIKEVVSRQQGLARTPGATETVNVPELVEDALRMNLSGVAQRDIEVIRDFKAVPPVRVEKHKVLQILVNLVRNAKQSCEVSGRQEKKLGIHTTRDNDHVRISVSDNGVGIPPENLARIFSHGFTTKKDGHGFGLHSCALAAAEMGGTLTTHSDGIGRGATFTLELPINAAQDQP